MDKLTSCDIAYPGPTDSIKRDEIPVLQDLVSRLPENPTIVNVGAAEGCSTLAILEARPDATIFSVDIEPCEKELENVERAGFDRAKVIRVLGRSSEVCLDWARDVDFVFMDGGKDSYEETLREIAGWWWHLKKGGIMAFHDYREPGWPAWNEAIDKTMVGYEQVFNFDAVDRSDKFLSIIAFWRS